MSSIALFGGWMGRVSLTVRTLCIQTTDDNDLGIRRKMEAYCSGRFKAGLLEVRVITQLSGALGLKKRCVASAQLETVST